MKSADPPISIFASCSCHIACNGCVDICVHLGETMRIKTDPMSMFCVAKFMQHTQPLLVDCWSGTFLFELNEWLLTTKLYLIWSSIAFNCLIFTTCVFANCRCCHFTYAENNRIVLIHCGLFLLSSCQIFWHNFHHPILHYSWICGFVSTWIGICLQSLIDCVNKYPWIATMFWFEVQWLASFVGTTLLK